MYIHTEKRKVKEKTKSQGQKTLNISGSYNPLKLKGKMLRGCNSDSEGLRIGQWGREGVEKLRAV
jgi:hypothetical protein